ncbi:MAG: hypothetical protein ACXVH1_36275 [Solirubrobacteraceae bacterium]
MGEDRARDELRTDILRRVERAANRKREADIDCDQAIDRAARLGLSHREIATAAQVTHGTAILTPQRRHCCRGPTVRHRAQRSRGGRRAADRIARHLTTAIPARAAACALSVSERLRGSAPRPVTPHQLVPLGGELECRDMSQYQVFRQFSMQSIREKLANCALIFRSGA